MCVESPGGSGIPTPSSGSIGCADAELSKELRKLPYHLIPEIVGYCYGVSIQTILFRNDEGRVDCKVLFFTFESSECQIDKKVRELLLANTRITTRQSDVGVRKSNVVDNIFRNTIIHHLVRFECDENGDVIYRMDAKLSDLYGRYIGRNGKSSKIIQMFTTVKIFDVVSCEPYLNEVKYINWNPCKDEKRFLEYAKSAINSVTYHVYEKGIIDSHFESQDLPLIMLRSGVSGESV